MELAIVCDSFKTLVFPWGGLWEGCTKMGGGLRCIHMWKLKAITIFPSLLWPHMAYSILLRASKHRTILSLSPALCLTAPLSSFACSPMCCQSDCLPLSSALNFSAILSVVCMYPFCLLWLCIMGLSPACWLAGRRACWTTASQLAGLVSEGEVQREGARAKERKREKGGGREHQSWR